MSTRMVVDLKNGLKELDAPESTRQPYAIRLIAKIVSYVFHPIFIPVYIACFLIFTQPLLFAGFPPGKEILLLLRFILMYTFFPLVTVLLSKALGFLQTIYLKTQKDRIIPYITCMIYYFWVWYVLRNQPEYPVSMVALTFAIFLSSIIGLMANIYFKISMHAISMGVLITFMVTFSFTHSVSGIYLALAFLVAGLVCTSRFIVSDHTPKEIYVGLFAGVASQLIAELTQGVLY